MCHDNQSADAEDFTTLRTVAMKAITNNKFRKILTFITRQSSPTDDFTGKNIPNYSDCSSGKRLWRWRLR